MLLIQTYAILKLTAVVNPHSIKAVVYIACAVPGVNASRNVLFLLEDLFLTPGKHDNIFKYATSFLYFICCCTAIIKLISQDINCRT